MHGCAILSTKRIWDVTCLDETHVEKQRSRTAVLTAMFPVVRALLCRRKTRARRTHLEILGGLEEDEKLQLMRVAPQRAWTETIYQRLVRMVTLRERQGGLPVPPPVLARIYADLSAGLAASSRAACIANVPFPYPLYELLRWIKWYFVVTCPLVIVALSTNVSAAIAAVFLSSLFFVSLLEVAEELEDPFGEDANDLPLLALHKEFNDLVHALVVRRPLDVDSAGSPDSMRFQNRLVHELYVLRPGAADNMLTEEEVIQLKSSQGSRYKLDVMQLRT